MWFAAPVGAVGSIVLLVAVASAKTILTKIMFSVVSEPIAYSLLSAFETALIIAPFAIWRRQFCLPRMDMFVRLGLVSVVIAIDLALSNEAIYLLPLPLQQAIASTIPAATILLETAVRQKCRRLLEYVTIAVLCFGAVLGHLGAGASIERSSDPEEIRSFFRGEAAMVAAVAAAATKYVFAKSILLSYREELGAYTLLLWIELFLCCFLLPWSIMTTELEALVTTGYTRREWCALAFAGAMGGFRFFCELLVLKFWSATTLSAANLSAHSLIIVVSIPLFGTPVTPYLISGTLVTLAASAFYAFLLVSSSHEAPSPSPVGKRAGGGSKALWGRDGADSGSLEKEAAAGGGRGTGRGEATLSGKPPIAMDRLQRLRELYGSAYQPIR